MTRPGLLPARRTRAGGGRVWRRARVQRHRATTANLAAAYPFLAEPGLGADGTYIGRDLFGGSFCFDPFELYAAGALTNPNILVTGAVGSGKSALVKTLLYRQAEFGRTAWVADPKGEYTALAHAIGAPVIRLAPGGPARLNPLDPLPAPDPGHDADADGGDDGRRAGRVPGAGGRRDDAGPAPAGRRAGRRGAGPAAAPGRARRRHPRAGRGHPRRPARRPAGAARAGRVRCSPPARTPPRRCG